MIRFLYAVALALFITLSSVAMADDKEHSGIMSDMQKAADHISIWQRYPIIGIPLIAKPPVIDGTVDVHEWFAAARINRFLDYTKGNGVRDKSDVYLAYTPTHLYIAFQFERPDNARKPTEKDLIEILFDPSHAGQKYYDVGATVEKIAWDGIGPNVDQKAWQPKWDYKARPTEFGWEGEMEIAFKEFAGYDAAPAPGTIWGVDFVRNEQTPTQRLATWSFRGKNWHAVKNLGHMLFTGKPIAFRTEGIGWIPDSQQAGVKILINNFSDQPATFDTFAELRKTNQPVTMDYYPRIDSAMAEDLPAAIGSTLKNEVTNALKDYPVLKEETQKVTVEPNGNKLVQLVLPDEPGTYLAGFSISEGGKLLAGSMMPVNIAVPLAIKMESYLYSANTLAYEVDLRRVADKITPTSQLFIVAKDADGKNAAEAKKPIAKGATEITGELKFTPKPDSTYTIIASIVDGEKTTTTNEEHLRVPAKPVWIGNQLGMKKFVPEPFVPVQATDKQCKVLTTTYDFSGDSILPEITAAGQEILAAPIAFTIKTTDGAILPIKLTSFEIKEKEDEKVVYAFKGDVAGKATLDGTIAIEFDGLAWYRLTLTPNSSLDVTGCALEFTLKKEFARYCTIGAAAEKGANAVYSGEIPAEGKHSAFSFSYWLGGIDGGVQWFAESQRGWSNANQKDVAQITADEQVGRLKINIIDKAVKIDKPVEWSFGLIATPSRVKPKDWGKYAFFQTAGIATPPAQFSAVADEVKQKDVNAYNKMKRSIDYFNSPGWQRDKKMIYAFVYHGYWQEIFGYPGTYDPKRQQLLKDSVKWLHGEGIKCIVYAGWGANTESPEWRDYGMEMVTLPLYNSGYGTFRQDPSTLWQDWFIYKTAEMIKDYDIDGLFIDSVTSPTISENYTEGMRWIDADGKVRGSYPILATRQWLKRLYKLWHGEMKNGGIIYNHNSPPAVMAIESFADVRTPSEFAQTHDGEFDQKFLDFFVAKNGGEQFGLFIELTNKDWMGGWAKKKTNQIYALSLPLNVSFKDVNLYEPYREHGNYGLDQQTMPWIWAANQWVDRSTADYLPWWKNAKYITVTPSDQVLTALWLHKGEKALLCVSNLNKAPRKIDVSLNLGELGMSGLSTEDAITGESIPADGGKLSLNVDFERYRLIKLTGK